MRHPITHGTHLLVQCIEDYNENYLHSALGYGPRIRSKNRAISAKKLSKIKLNKRWWYSNVSYLNFLYVMGIDRQGKRFLLVNLEVEGGRR